MRSLPDYWASPEDFAALFQYFWLRDLPVDLKSTGARVVDWTIHIGIVVRNIGDLMGLTTRFERGGRKDALYRSVAGDEIALEWEWNGIYGNELSKLKKPKRIWRRYNDGKGYRYAVLISYTDENGLTNAVDHTREYWSDAAWPLLVILVVCQQDKNLTTRRAFKRLKFFLFEPGVECRLLRDVPAMPWEVDCSRWQYLLSGD